MIDNLTEAISHAKEVAEEQKKKAESNIIETTKEGWIRVYDGKEYNDCLECAREHEQLAEWLEELKARREADKWISVKERIPAKTGRYLVTYSDGEVDACFYSYEFISGKYEVTHWKPLPKPYESEDK